MDILAKIHPMVIVALLTGGGLLADAGPALAYVNPILPGLVYQIGYLIVYGTLGVIAFFKLRMWTMIKRLFKRPKSSTPES